MNGSTDARLASNFRLLADSASTIAGRVDLLFAALLLLCGLVALGVCGAIVYFCIRYRRGSAASRAGALHRSLGLELGWTLLPLALFMGLFAWAAYDFVQMQRAPADALPVVVVAKQWMWKLQHRNGRREINELHVPQGRPVRLLMSSQDAIHSFFVPAFRLKQDVLPGRTTQLWFTATQLGDFHLLCAEYCGSEHSRMLGRVVVMTPADYARWLDSGPPQPGPEQQGFALYRRLGCSGCHEAGSTVHAPSLAGIWGRTVHLADGRSVNADEVYLRDSILLPARDVVAGYAPLMPSFAGQVDEEDLRALLAYLRVKEGP